MPGGYPSSWEIGNCTDVGTVAASSVGTTVTNSGTAGTYGSYTQLVASSAIDTCFVAIMASGGNFVNSNNLIIKIAVGAGGSEVDIIQDLMCFDGGPTTLSWWYCFPIGIPAGTRISAATAGSQNGADSLKVSLLLFDGAYAQIEGCAGVDSIGVVSSAHGTSMSAGAANTKGSYVQLTASTPRDYLGIVIAFDDFGSPTVGASPMLVDIAIGGAGSEVVIVSNMAIGPGGNLMTGTSTVLSIPIPAGTRVAARYQNVAGTGAIGIVLYGVYQ